METCALVDAYGPGMFFVPILKEKGYNIIHIQSSKNIPSPFCDFIQNAGFKNNLSYDNNLDQIIDILKNENVTGIIPGYETGVSIADIISEKLSNKTNGTSLSAARRNKSVMIDALRLNNIPTVNCLKTNNVKSAIEWVNNNSQYPVITKPVDSASSEDVYICHNENELQIACKKTLNKTNLMGCENIEVLIQSYLTGTEYVINSVSCEGKHYVTDIWICKKRIVENRIIYDREELIPFEGEAQSQLVTYLYKVLDALGIKYGAAHSEIMLTKNGPILLETGARIGGAVNPTIHQECFGSNQVELNIDALMTPAHFFAKTIQPYKIKKYLYVVMAVAKNEGIIKNIILTERLQELSSMRFIRLKKKIGDMLQKTIDLTSSPATIYLSSDNKTKLEEDYQKLLSIIDDSFEIE